MIKFRDVGTCLPFGILYALINQKGWRHPRNFYKKKIEGNVAALPKVA